jgi:hypothetical protein
VKLWPFHSRRALREEVTRLRREAIQKDRRIDFWRGMYRAREVRCSALEVEVERLHKELAAAHAGRRPRPHPYRWGHLNHNRADVRSDTP